MSIYFVISKKGLTVTEIQKVQLAYAVTILNYVLGNQQVQPPPVENPIQAAYTVALSYVTNVNAQSINEAAKMTASYSVTTFNYTLSANAQTITEAQKVTPAYAVTGLSYS